LVSVWRKRHWLELKGHSVYENSKNRQNAHSLSWVVTVNRRSDAAFIVTAPDLT